MLATAAGTQVSVRPRGRSRPDASKPCIRQSIESGSGAMLRRHSGTTDPIGSGDVTGIRTGDLARGDRGDAAACGPAARPLLAAAAEIRHPGACHRRRDARYAVPGYRHRPAPCISAPFTGVLLRDLRRPETFTQPTKQPPIGRKTYGKYNQGQPIQLRTKGLNPPMINETGVVRARPMG